MATVVGAGPTNANVTQTIQFMSVSPQLSAGWECHLGRKRGRGFQYISPPRRSPIDAPAADCVTFRPPTWSTAARLWHTAADAATLGRRALPLADHFSLRRKVDCHACLLAPFSAVADV